MNQLPLCSPKYPARPRKTRLENSHHFRLALGFSGASVVLPARQKGTELGDWPPLPPNTHTHTKNDSMIIVRDSNCTPEPVGKFYSMSTYYLLDLSKSLSFKLHCRTMHFLLLYSLFHWGTNNSEKVWVAQLCPTLLLLYELQPIRLLCPWDSPGKTTGVVCHSFLQGIFLTQGLNPGF